MPKKKPNRLFYTVKLSSGLLKEHKNKLDIPFEECIKNSLIVSLADSQMLRTIRDITGQKIDREQLEEWYDERDRIKKRKNSKENRARIKELQTKIWDMMYIPDYITVVMENIKDYEKIFKKGFIFNGKRYRRISCSASQARVSTVAFCSEDIKDEVKRRLDCGRDLDKPLAPSKYNAYFGLYSSAIKEVTKPRFCIIPDYEENQYVDVDYVVEQAKDEDDIIEPRTIEIEFNRFDGSGLISPQMAEQWAKDINEDYVPCQFCIRSAFTKGMVNEFDFVEWCKEENNGNYFIKDSFGNLRDIREIDVILTEGMAKLWDSWNSQEHFEKCCEENGIIWGVTKYAPKKDKEVLTTNYQYLQTLNLTDEMIKDVCKDTVDYIQGVSYDNIYYTELFMMGENSNEESLRRFLESSDNYWLKTLILNNNLLYDKYSKEKIRDMIIRRIELSCLGKIHVQGNFQCIVPDSFAFMQHVTGQKVTGLLEAGEFYSQFWNEKNVHEVDCMRSPMTHFSEHYIAKLKKNEKTEKWFKYSYSGIITNCHDAHTMAFSGSDYDFDILSTTNNKNFIKGKFPNQRVVTYDVKIPKKRLFTEDDLFSVDTFSFGTQIGQITNVCSTFVGLISEWKQGTKERQMLEDRIKMCCASQSRQIDKTKIGENVKALVPHWTQFQRLKEEDTIEEMDRKNFLNSILADRKPYFFRYKYNHLNKELNQYLKKANLNCQTRFHISLKQLQQLPQEELTEAQETFLYYHKKFMPVVDSSCVMNKICHYIENIDFEIKKKVRSSQGFDYTNLLSSNFILDKKFLKEIQKIVNDNVELWRQLLIRKNNLGIGVYNGNHDIDNDNKKFDENIKTDKELKFQILKGQLEEICSNEERLTNHLIYLFYVEKPSLNKSYLWSLVGKQIYENVRSKTRSFYFPFKNPNGSLEFLYEKYSIERVLIEEEKESKE